MSHRLRTGRRFLAGLCAGGLALSSAACIRPGEARRGEPPRSTQRSGSDRRTVESVLADYEAAQSALLAASRGGAKAYVSILGADGLVHSGYDVFRSAPETKILEVRDTGISMQVGDTACRKQEGHSLFECQSSDPLRIGLFEAPRSRVVKAWSEDVPCGESARACRFLKLRLLAEPDDEAVAAPGSADADLVGHDYEVLATLPDLRPVYLRQIDRNAIGATGMALFRFVFDEPVASFELPSEAERTRTPDGGQPPGRAASDPATSSSARTDP